MSETNISPEVTESSLPETKKTINLTWESKRLPRLGKLVLAETKKGFLVVAARQESVAEKNVYYWAIMLEGKQIGKLPDVIGWYE